MKILGIETSCDETSAAVVENGQVILSNIVASSADMHVKTGGIIPEKAAREQVKSMVPVLKEAVLSALSDKSIGSGKGIDAIAVTVGPGLIGSLLVGVECAKTLSVLWNKPIVPVNHLIAHIYANWIKDTPNSPTPDFPIMALVVSGGHTDLVLLEKHGKIKRIGGTRDDAAGEAFDKTARLMGLPYPGGPSISKMAEQYDKRLNLQIALPRPMIKEENFDFSFSGLKTAIFKEVNHLKQQNQFDQETIKYLCFEVQEAITDVLVTKTLRAVNKFRPKSLILAGGVSANQRLREKFKNQIEKDNINIDYFVPQPKLSTDNAACIAAYANYNYYPQEICNISANPELSITD